MAELLAPNTKPIEQLYTHHFAGMTAHAIQWKLRNIKRMSAPAHATALDRLRDVGSRFLRRLLQETAASLLEQISHTKALFESQYGDYPSLQRIERVVTQQCHRVTRI